MVVSDLQPASIVEDQGFQKFVNVLDPKYKPPSRRTIMNEYLPTLYESKKKSLIDQLAETKWCTLTTDLWTSRTAMGYMTVTCHYITPEWVLESRVLETCHISESHTSINLSNELKKVTEKWQISSKIHCVITDGASNIKGAIRMNQWNNLVCFAHRLNLVVTNAISEVTEAKEIIDSVKKIVAFFHKSSNAAEKLKQLQNRLNLPEHRLIQSVETRWNSTFYMLKRYAEQNDAINTALCVQDRTDLVLSSETNPAIQEMITILSPFEVVTTELSSENYISASRIIPLARGLQKLVNTMSQSTYMGTALRQKLTEQMASRFQNLEEKGVLAIATLLDPRFEKIPFSPQLFKCYQADDTEDIYLPNTLFKHN